MENNNVIHLVPGHSAVFSGDQSAVQDAWRAHHGELKRLNTSRVILFSATGLGVLLAGLGVLIWALSPRPVQQTVVQAPPVTVNVPQQEPPHVTVNVPKQDPVTAEPLKAQSAPPLPLGTATPGNSTAGKTVVDFTVFHKTEVGRMLVVTGWAYKTVEDKSPTRQWCYIENSPSNAHIARIDIGRHPEGIKFARQLGYSDKEIEQALGACQWFQGVNINIRERTQ